ncbi:MAG: 6-carboxytetrahydropterin synthase [Lachnospiraceae bacterium]|nr:6-carboxytetrahydropterin synthase [Lachnospiraceae bacterium]
MDNSIFCEYRLKFYLNGNHYLMIGNKKGETHPHTWELVVEILVKRSEFMEFNVYEKEIENLIAPYQNKVLNDLHPFDYVLPTLENIVEQFGNQIRYLVKKNGGRLIRIEGSESPTRSYIISYYTGDDDDELEMEKYAQSTVSSVVDTVLDGILG